MAATAGPQLLTATEIRDLAAFRANDWSVLSPGSGLLRVIRLIRITSLPPLP